MAQQILSIRGQGGANPGDTITLDILYEVDDGTQVTGLSSELLYDSDELEFVSATNNPNIPAPGLLADTANPNQDDGDPDTDRAIFASYGPAENQAFEPTFPNFDENGNPARLYTAEFEVTDAFDGTTLNIELASTPQEFEDPELQSFELTPNEPPEFAQDVFNFDIDENSAVDTLVGTAEASDDNGDPLSFAIAAGNDDVDGDEELAFDINDQGDILVNDPDDLDFEEQEQFTLDLTVADPSGGEDTATATIALNDIVEDEPPQFAQDVFNFDIDENVDGNIAAGDVVGTVNATDPNDDNLTFAIAAGNDDVDGDGELAFDINDQGEILVNDPDDLDFEEQEQFTLDLTVADPGGEEDTATANIAINDIQEGGVLEPDDLDNNIFRVNGSDADPAELRHTLEGRLGSDLVEVGLVLLEDGEATEDALADGANIRSVFSVLPENEDGNSGEQVSFPDGFELSRILSADSARVGYILNNNEDRQTIDEIVDEGNLGDLEVGGFDPQDLGNGSFRLSSGDLSLTVEAAQEGDIPLGAGGAQSGEDLEVFDLTQAAGQPVTATLSFDVISQADFDNAVGFYRVDDASGAVNGVNPDQEGYADEVLGAALQDGNGEDVILQRNTQTGDVNVQLQGGQTIAPFLLPDVGDIDELPDEAAGESILGVQSGSDVFTPFAAANPEGADHFRLLGDNIFGVEDLRGGGDQDFNDFVFGAEFA